jgi:two-component sensor histidine kinase
MYDREYRDTSRLYNIENDMRKSRDHRSSYVAIEKRECFGETADRFESLAQRHQELVPEAGSL